jgi:hypothetical protein
MVLRFIETNDVPEIGKIQLVKDSLGSIRAKIISFDWQIVSHLYVLLPYGVSNKEIRAEQLVKGTKILSLVDDESYGEVFEVDTDVIGWEQTFAGDTESRIIHILPEHFDLHEVANLGFKDGDEFDFKYADHITDAVTITPKQTFIDKDVKEFFDTPTLDPPIDYFEQEETLIKKLFNLDELLEFQSKNDVQIIRGEDYQYMCYINKKGYTSALTPLGALIFGIKQFKIKEIENEGC